MLIELCHVVTLFVIALVLPSFSRLNPAFLIASGARVSYVRL